jgi:hypothetical protein
MSIAASGIRVEGLDELIAGLKAVAGPRGLRDIRQANREIATHVARRVEHDARASFFAHYRGGRKDSMKHPLPGHLLRGIKPIGSARNASVAVSDGGYGYLILQEFGGKSYWHGSGRGALRQANRAHAAVETLSGGYIGTGRVATKGHIIYTKPRRTRGYFIWNAAYRERAYIGKAYSDAIERAFERHGVRIEMARDQRLNIDETAWSGH